MELIKPRYSILKPKKTAPAGVQATAVSMVTNPKQITKPIVAPTQNASTVMPKNHVEPIVAPSQNASTVMPKNHVEPNVTPSQNASAVMPKGHVEPTPEPVIPTSNDSLKVNSGSVASGVGSTPKGQNFGDLVSAGADDLPRAFDVVKKVLGKLKEPYSSDVMLPIGPAKVDPMADWENEPEGKDDSYKPLLYIIIGLFVLMAILFFIFR